MISVRAWLTSNDSFVPNHLTAHYSLTILSFDVISYELMEMLEKLQTKSICKEILKRLKVSRANAKKY
jgi:hypothetical protein